MVLLLVVVWVSLRWVGTSFTACTRLAISHPLLFEYVHKYVYNNAVNFTWDETKRQTNRHEHGFDFADASQVFEGPTFTFEDDRFAYDEQRFITIGLLRGRLW